MRSRILSIAAAAGLMVGTTAICFAQNSAQENAPGQRMQDKGSVPGIRARPVTRPAKRCKRRAASRASQELPVTLRVIRDRRLAKAKNK